MLAEPKFMFIMLYMFFSGIMLQFNYEFLFHFQIMTLDKIQISLTDNTEKGKFTIIKGNVYQKNFIMSDDPRGYPLMVFQDH